MLKRQRAVYLTAVFMCLIFLGCSEKKDKQSAPEKSPITQTTTPKEEKTPEPATTLEEESSTLAELIVVFSTSNDLMKKYPSFKLGLYDVIAHIRTPENLARVSLYNLQPIATTDYIHTTAVELSHLQQGTHLYLGSFSVPEGTLEHLELHVVGDNSYITIDNDSPTLIDAFFTTYTPGDSRLQARQFPAETLSAVSGDITLSTQKPTLIDVQMDMNLTATMDPVRHTEPARSYALFTPSMTITEKTTAVDITINQLNFASFTDTTVGIGQTEYIAFMSNYTLGTDAKIIIDGSDATSLATTSGLYAMDISGTFTPSATGHAITINRASLSAPSENSTASVYSGYVNITDNSLAVNGTQQNLSLSSESLAGSIPFNGTIPDINVTGLGLTDGQLATLWVNGENAKVLNQRTLPTAAATLFFNLHATLSYPPEDILSIKTSTSTDTSLVLTLDEALACADWVVNTASSSQPSCSGTLTSIEFTKSATGKYTLHETRRGEITGKKTEGKSDFSLKPDKVFHYDKMDDFLSALENRVKKDKFRLTTLTAEGVVNGSIFKAESKVKVTLLQPNESLDDESDAWFAGLKDEATDPLGTDKSKNIALYAGLGIAGVVGVAAVAYLVKRILTRKDIPIELGAEVAVRSSKTPDPTVDGKLKIGPSGSGIIVDVIDDSEKIVPVKQGPEGLTRADGQDLDTSKLKAGQAYSLTPVEGVSGTASNTDPSVLLYPTTKSGWNDLNLDPDLYLDILFDKPLAEEKLPITSEKVKTEYDPAKGIILNVGDNVTPIDSLKVRKANDLEFTTIDLTDPKNGTLEFKKQRLFLTVVENEKPVKKLLATYNNDTNKLVPAKKYNTVDLISGSKSVLPNIETAFSTEHQRMTQASTLVAKEVSSPTALRRRAPASLPAKISVNDMTAMFEAKIKAQQAMGAPTKTFNDDLFSANKMNIVDGTTVKTTTSVPKSPSLPTSQPLPKIKLKTK